MAKEIAYVLEKGVWTEADYSVMGWHDSWIHALAVLNNEDEPWKNELLFDLDYIFQWVDPAPPSSYYTFWTSPCTLSFYNFYDLVFRADIGTESFEVANLNLVEKITNPHNGLVYFNWEIKLQGGLISLKSEGFDQIVRKNPVHTSLQKLNDVERGGISFDKTACQLN